MCTFPHGSHAVALHRFICEHKTLPLQRRDRMGFSPISLLSRPDGYEPYPGGHLFSYYSIIIGWPLQPPYLRAVVIPSAGTFVYYSFPDFFCQLLPESRQHLYILAAALPAPFIQSNQIIPNLHAVSQGWRHKLHRYFV